MVTVDKFEAATRILQKKGTGGDRSGHRTRTTIKEKGKRKRKGRRVRERFLGTNTVCKLKLGGGGETQPTLNGGNAEERLRKVFGKHIGAGRYLHDHARVLGVSMEQSASTLSTKRDARSVEEI